MFSGRADFEDPCGTDRRRQYPQQRADLGVDERQILFGASSCDLLQHRIGQMIQPGEVALDGIRDDLTHN